MYKISIVEDSKKDMAAIKNHINTYFCDIGESYELFEYYDVETFLNTYSCDSDIVFMDIELPGMNGMRGAAKLREIDKSCILIFVTNMIQYAISGYEVGAFDYIVKPITYKVLLTKLKRVFNHIDQNRNDYIYLHEDGRIKKISFKDIIYVEIRLHSLMYHLNSKTINTSGTLNNVEKQLEGKKFVRCNSCYIVNMRYIKEVRNDSIVMDDGTELSVSRRKKKDFLEAYSAYRNNKNG
jgi:DNA-binding LytR/AlgR family response regulator